MNPRVMADQVPRCQCCNAFGLPTVCIAFVVPVMMLFKVTFGEITKWPHGGRETRILQDLSKTIEYYYEKAFRA